MSTFSYTDPPTSQKDHVRYLIGDTDVSDNGLYAMLSDESITSALSSYGWLGGIAFLAQGLLTRFAQEPTKFDEGEGLTIDLSERLDAWRQLLSDARSGKISDPSAGATGAEITISPSVAVENIPVW